MPNPLPNDQHVDQYLTGLSADFVLNDDQFIAGKVFPTIPVAHKSDLYTIWPRGYFLRDEMRERPLGERARRIGYKVSNGTYNCTEDAVSHAVDDRVRANANMPLDPDKAAMRLLTSQALIHQERDWANSYFKTGVWGLDVGGVSSGPTGTQFLQFDQTGSDPVGLIDLRRDLMAESGSAKPNTLVLGTAVLRALKKHPAIMDLIKYTQRGVITQELLAELFGVERVFVPGGVQNTAAEGQADAISPIVGTKSMLLTYATPAPSIDTPSAGYTFAWTGLIPGVTNAFGGVITRFREEQAHSDVFEVRVASDQKAVAPDMGVFFGSVVA